MVTGNYYQKTVNTNESEIVFENDERRELLDGIMLELGTILNYDELKESENIILNALMKYDVKRKEVKQLPAEFTMLNQKLKQDFLIAKKLKGASEHTIKLYNAYVNKFITEINKSVLNVSDVEIQYSLYMYEKSGVSKVTVNNYRACINSFFTWLQIKKFRMDNPMLTIDKIKFEYKEKKPFTKAEIQKLKDSTENIREKLVINLLLSTGIRCEELTKIKLTDIDFKNRTILIHGKGSYQRTALLNDVCFMYLEEYIKFRLENKMKCEYLICSARKHKNKETGKLEYVQSTNSTIGGIVKKVAQRCDVYKAHPHKFRRTFCCAAVDATDILVASKLMGHHSLNTTKIYTVTSDKKINYEFDKIIV